MLKQLLLVTLAVLAITIIGAGSRPPARAAVVADFVVDDGMVDCLNGGAADYQHISAAIAAVHANQTIFVCAGTYSEPALAFSQSSDVEGVFLEGPGFTVENDGVANVTITPNPGSSIMPIAVKGVQVRGLNIDAGGHLGVEITGENVTLTDNVITNGGVDAIDDVKPGANITHNTLTDGGDGIICYCPNSYVDRNIISSAPFHRQIDVLGANIHVGDNTVTNGFVRLDSDMGRVSGNSIDGGGQSNTLLYVVGNSVNVLNNTLSNGTGTGLLVEDRSPGTVDTTGYILGNTFTSIANPVLLHDTDPNSGFGVKVIMGDVPADGNVFVNSGGTLSDENYLLQLDGVKDPVPAENNNWGYCQANQIEAEIHHFPDDPSLGTVDYEPFVDPVPCPTFTPSPTPSPTPTHTPLAVAWGDVNCDGVIDLDDFWELLLYAAGVSDGVMPDCAFNLGDDIGSFGIWGDITCDGVVDERDALAVLVHLSGAEPLPATGNCLAIGDPFVD